MFFHEIASNAYLNMEKSATATKGPIPQHNNFYFPDITFSSDFDSGNLIKVERISQTHFALWVGPDCVNTQSEKSFRTWFYFSVCTTGVKTFTIKNLNLQGKLFRDGMKPLYKTPTQDWKRLESSLNYDVKGEVGSYFEVTFSFDFKDPIVFFSFSFPWTYSDCQSSLAMLKRMTDLDFYLNISTLVHSLEKRSCDLITLSSNDKLTTETEAELPGLFENFARPLKFSSKPVILITARVHPGESPSSHMLNGMVDFLLSPDDRAQVLRGLYVFKIIPMLNPDGVYRGYYRTDTRGQDLNRVYADASLAKHPTIYAVTELLKYHGQDIHAYIDLHAHVSKQGCFVYGNSLDYQDQVLNVLFAKLMASTCPWFNFDKCNFEDEPVKENLNMGQVCVSNQGKIGVNAGKEGCGRVIAQKLLKLVHSYTFEVNYHSSKPTPLQENFDLKNCLLDIKNFALIGEMALIGLLYLSGKHPFPDVDLEQAKLETGKILAALPRFRCNAEARKASRSIENLNKFISTAKDSRMKCRIASILVEKKVKRSFNSSTPSTQIQYPQIIKEIGIGRSRGFDTKVVVSNENSFQIRPRNSSFVKTRKMRKVRKISMKMQDISYYNGIVLLYLGNLMELKFYDLLKAMLTSF